ncbi:MAG: hypothetical protein ABIH78_03125 [Candidatus Peregrinibacteria bacterium]
MTNLHLQKKEKKFLKCLLGKDRNRETIADKCHFTEKEVTEIEYKLMKVYTPPLICKFSILGINEEEKKSKSGGTISPLTLTSEGKKIICPWYKKTNIWIMIGTLLTALFTGILAIKTFI